MEERGVPLFKTTLKRELRQGAHVRRKMLELLDESNDPLPPYQLTKLLVGSDVYPMNPKPKTKVSFVRKALVEMERRRFVEMVGEMRAEKGGTQKIYKLTQRGRMVASFAPTKRKLSKEEAVLRERDLRENQDQRIVEFMNSEWKRGNFFVDFGHYVILEVIKEGISEGGRKFFESYVELLCEGPVDQSGDWADMWARSMNHSEDVAYAKAVLKVLRTLPEERRGPVSGYLKHWIENNYLESVPPSAEYIRAVEEGGELVHVLRACTECAFEDVVTESVEQHFEDIINGHYMTQVECPNCGSELWTFK